MKKFNITAQAYDLCSSNPKQSILVNNVIESSNEQLAKDLFSRNMLIDDILVKNILSVEEISQEAA
jgi:hypothetical protein